MIKNKILFNTVALILISVFSYSFLVVKSDTIVLQCDRKIRIDTRGLEYEVTRNDTDDLFYFITPRLSSSHIEPGYFMVSCTTGSTHFYCCSQDEYLVTKRIEDKRYVDLSGTMKDGSMYWRQLSFPGRITIIYEKVPADRLGIANDIIDQVYAQMIK